MESKNNMEYLIDIHYCNIKMMIYKLDQNIYQTKLKNPSFRLYNGNQIINNQLLKFNQTSYSLINLTQYRDQQQLQTQYPDSVLDGYLNLQFKGPFKQNEILSKYIIENNLQFKIPAEFFKIYFNITDSYIYLDIYHSYDFKLNCTYLLSETQSEVNDDYTSLIFDNRQSLVCKFISIVKQYSSQNLVFLLGNKMNNTRKSVIVQTLQQQGIQCQTIDKKGRNNQNYYVKQIKNIPEFNNVYFVDMCHKFETQELCQFQQIVTQYNNNKDLEIKLKTMEYLQIPLSFALYETNSSNVQMLILRKYFENNYMFVYNSQNIEKSKIKMLGGLLSHATEDLQTRILQDVAEGDFYSLHASIIVDKNISYETVHQLKPYEQIQLHKQRTYSNQEIKILNDQRVNIDMQEGVVPKITKQLLQLRSQLQNSEIVEKQALKLLLVNIYGNFGTEYLSLYNPICSNLIVEYSRLTCNIAKQGILSLNISDNVIQQQTDSCQFLPKIQCNSQQFKDRWVLLQEYINTNLNTLNQKLIFKFEQDKYAKYMIISKSKNTSVSYIFNDKTNKYEVNLKGDLNSIKYSGYKINTIKQYFRQLFESKSYINKKLSLQLDCSCQIQDSGHSNDLCYYNLYQREFDKLITSIQDKDIQTIVQNYGIYLNYSQDDSLCQYISVNFGVSKSCKYTFHGEKIIPCQKLTENNLSELQVDHIIFDLLRPIKSILTSTIIEPSNNIQLYNKHFIEQIQTYGNIKDLPDLPLENECIVRVETIGVKQFITQPFDELQQLIMQNPNKSFHEVLHKNVNKMYFDIDSKTPIDEFIIMKTIQFTIAKLIPQKINPKIHTCTATYINNQSPDLSKYSYHIIVDIACTIELNKLMAKMMNSRFQQLTQSNQEIFDISVYKSTNQSLRLPLCVKICKKTYIDKRPLIIQGDSCFRDFIIGDIKQCSLLFNNIIHFDKQYPIDPAILSDQYQGINVDQSMILESISKLTNTSINRWQMKQLRIISSAAYKCPVCDQIHDNDNLSIKFSKKNQTIYLNCYSNILRQGNIHRPIPLFNKQDLPKSSKKQNFQELYNQINETNTFLDITTQRLNLCHIKFEIVNSTTYIVSDMGTGKSQQMKEFIQKQVLTNPNVSILCLSFRRTFSIEFAQKYQLDNYMDIKGRIDLSKKKKLIVQVDSLTRCDLTQAPDFLIVDEIESILERIYQCNNPSEVTNKFLKLIQSAKNVIYMDGLIEKKTIENLNLMREVTSYDVVLNEFSPRKHYTYLLIPMNINQKNVAVNYLIEMIKLGKRVYGMITSKDLGFYIIQEIQKIMPEKKIIFYHGSDQKDQEDITATSQENIHSTHIKVKRKHFQNVNNVWDKYDVVLHNSAITAGVSFDTAHFDLQINIYSSQTTSPLSFFQGCHRVRHLKDQLVITFLQQQFKNSTIATPFDLFSEEVNIESSLNISTDFDFSKQKQFQLWNHSRYECTRKYYVNILLKYIKRMNYSVIFSLDDIPNHIDKQIKAILSLVSMTGKAINLTAQQINQLQDIVINREDQSLYNEQYKEKTETEDFHNFKINYLKLQKLDILRLYHIDFEDINNLNKKQLKILIKQQEQQGFRNIIKTAFLNNLDPQQTTEWLTNIINNFRTFRQNNRNNDSRSYIQIKLLQLAEKLTQKYHPTKNTKIDIKDLKKDMSNIKIQLDKTQINVYSYNLTKLKEGAAVDYLNTFFNLFFLELKINKEKQTIYVDTIKIPIYQYLTGYTPSFLQLKALQTPDSLILDNIVKYIRKRSY